MVKRVMLILDDVQFQMLSVLKDGESLRWEDFFLHCVNYCYSEGLVKCGTLHSVSSNVSSVVVDNVDVIDKVNVVVRGAKK